jgi:hypothetical protein
VLANLLLHHVFDSFMVDEFPSLPWARYADDGVVHAVSKAQALCLKDRLARRFQAYRLELHPDKARVVCCGRDKGICKQDNVTFDLLGYAFKPRRAAGKTGKRLTGFLPAIATKAKKAIRQEAVGWKLQRRVGLQTEGIAKEYGPKIRGWVNHYGKSCPSEAKRTFDFINSCLCK